MIDAMSVTVHFNILISEERRSEIQAAAKAREVTSSAWVREAIREKLEREISAIELAALRNPEVMAAVAAAKEQR